MTPQEEKEVLALSKGATLEYDRNETFVDLFLKNAKDHSGLTAVADIDGKISYGDLALYTNVVANRLIELGVKNNDFVIIKMPRCKEFMIAVIGILRAGACYVPVDPEFPADRIKYMTEDCGAKVTIDEEWLLGLKKHYGMKALFLDKVNRAEPEGLAYMLYTSGSTGKPKGVMLPHKALRAFIAWQIDRFNLKPGFRSAEHVSFCFDLSVMDLCGTLAAGGEVHVIHEEIRKDLEAVNAFLTERKIEGMVLGTQFGTELLNNCEIPLRYVLLCGEKLLPFRKQRPDLEVINLYGPTEFTIGCSIHVVDLDKDSANIPIGRPHPNTWNFIIDKEGKLLPRGEVGELCLAGAQMGKGYWNKPDKTAAAFVPCPFLPGEIMYKTGDLAKWNENGELECLGRIDNQVKIRGYRIELGEIENVAVTFPDINMVAAAAKDIGGIKHLILYFTGNKNITENELNEFLGKSLAPYMIPEMCIQLEKMPMTPNGKIDRKQLPTPEIGRTTEYVEPQGDTEKLIAECFAEVLGLTDKVGANDSFFALGGESLKAICLISLLKKKGLQRSVADIMKCNTVRELAAATPSQTPAAKPDENAPWSSAAREKAEKHYAQKGMVIERAYPVTGLQEFMTMSASDDNTRIGFNEILHFSMDTCPEDALFRKALDMLAERHEAFRTAIVYKDLDDPVQVILTGRTISLKAKDLSNLSNELLCKELDKIVLEEMARPIDLEEDALASLLKIRTQDGCHLIFTIHHSIFDGWSVPVFIGDFRRFLTFAMKPVPFFTRILNFIGISSTPKDPILPQPVPQYRYEKYVRSIRSLDQAPAMDFWKKLFDGYTHKAILPSSGPVAEKDRASSNTISATVNAEYTTKLEELARNERTTINTIIELAWGHVLQSCNNTNDVIFAKIVSRRGIAEDDVRDAVGLFMGAVAVRVKTEKAETVREAIAKLQAQIAESTAFEYCSEYAIASVSPLGMDVFQSLYVNADYGDETGGDIPGAIAFKQIPTPVSAGNELELHPHYADKGLAIDIVFDTALFTEADITAAKTVLESTLAAIADNPSATFISLPPYKQ